MDHLIELVQFLSKNKFKHMEVFAKNSRLREFYEKLRNGSLKTEQEARDYFFPNDKNAKTYYYRLAQQLEERLVNLLFLVDFNQTAANELQRDALICYRNYAAAQSLMARFMRNAAIKIAEETIKISLKNEFTDLTLPFARMLAIHYGTHVKHKTKFEYYTKLLENMQELLEAEILAERYHSEITMHYNLKRSADLVFAQRIAGYVEKLKTYTDRLSSYRLNLYAHHVFIYQSMFMTDYAKTVEICRNALQYFEQQKQKTPRIVLLNFSSRLMASLQMLGQYAEGISIGKNVLTLAPSLSVSWFSLMEDLYRLYLHSGQYELALENINEVKNNPALSKQAALLQERWQINEAMIHYLIRSGKLQQPQGLQTKFRIRKFINDSSGSIHDKSGNNTLLITLMILFLLLDKDYSSIIDKIDALKAYTHRHLRRDETYRTNCFIKMIMQLDKGDFHQAAVQRKAEPYYKKLLEVPLHKAKQDYELEIIPYETLWSFILESLESSRKTKVQDK